VGKLLRDLSLENRLPLIQCEPSEVVITKNHEVYISSNVKKTRDDLIRNFPRERQGITDFLKYITTREPLQLYVELKDLTFRQVLDRYLSDLELKSVLSTLLGNIGLPSFKASALTSAFLFREFIFDGGYYPKGGMQQFPDKLIERFQEYGGTALLLSPVESIHIRNGSVKGVTLRYRGRMNVTIDTKLVVANCDPFQVFGELIRANEGNPINRISSSIENRVITPSAFMVHLGIRHDISKVARFHTNIWSYTCGDIDQYYEAVLEGKVEFGKGSFLFCSIPTFHDPTILPKGLHSIQAIIAAPYYDRHRWEGMKDRLTKDVIERLEEYIPGLRNWIEVEQIAIPPTLVKYTAGYKGAMYGWASIPEQVGRRKLPEETTINGLFLVGHWTGLPSGHSGLPTVVTSGRNVARLALKVLRLGKGSCSLNGTVNVALSNNSGHE
jgi:phytoene dehydrogenase-like protein